MSLSRLMKKLKESGGLIGEDGDITKTADSTSPPKKAGKKGEKKRVATSDKEGTSEGPPKAKKARGKKTSGDSGKTESGDDEQD
ncbi:hypothetical protein EJ08DRAFT_652330 [Tothia fuscella]|uniref:Uncharacterized protein n=1 Tax=Tothia fuscella TaxID=1048955 RepID=A0A9P4NJZ4_9PEZI|nr:hypothetical protein EJ08DRAFT_652330 [Tothia fuscella]